MGDVENEETRKIGRGKRGLNEMCLPPHSWSAWVGRTHGNPLEQVVPKKLFTSCHKTLTFIVTYNLGMLITMGLQYLYTPPPPLNKTIHNHTGIYRPKIL